MIGRRTESNGLIWGRGERRRGRNGGHHRAGTAAGGEFGVVGASRTRRQGGPSQDRALYACGCGEVFDALVTTSVDCPECGSTQAW